MKRRVKCDVRSYQKCWAINRNDWSVDFQKHLNANSLVLCSCANQLNGGSSKNERDYVRVSICFNVRASVFLHL